MAEQTGSDDDVLGPRDLPPSRPALDLQGRLDKVPDPVQAPFTQVAAETC